MKNLSRKVSRDKSDSHEAPASGTRTRVARATIPPTTKPSALAPTAANEQRSAVTAATSNRLPVPTRDPELLALAARASARHPEKTQEHIVGRDVEGEHVVDVIMRDGPALRATLRDWRAACAAEFDEILTSAPTKKPLGLAAVRSALARTGAVRRAAFDADSVAIGLGDEILNVPGLGDDESVSTDGVRVWYVRRLGHETFQVRVLGLLVDDQIAPNLVDWISECTLVAAEPVEVAAVEGAA